VAAVNVCWNPPVAVTFTPLIDNEPDTANEAEATLSEPDTIFTEPENEADPVTINEPDTMGLCINI
jgi:hypothetical protein